MIAEKFATHLENMMIIIVDMRSLRRERNIFTTDLFFADQLKRSNAALNEDEEEGISKLDS